ncbi:MAG TPA: VOC family protein [Kribbella sp.]|nr:VOC family protein [Kribbella sp.]
MIYELNHVGGRIQDLDASLAFYTGLGAEVVDRLFMTSSRVNRVHVQIATGLVELLHNEEPDPDATYGLNHVGFMTDDLDADYARLIALGYAELSSPRVAGSGQGRLAFLADPNGVRIELLQRSEEFRIPPITSGPVRRLSYIAVTAPDLDAAIEFYGTHLGMQRVPSDDSPGTATFRLGDDAVKLHKSLPPATTPINHLALTTTTPRPDTHDPDGNSLTFLQDL